LPADCNHMNEGARMKNALLMSLAACSLLVAACKTSQSTDSNDDVSGKGASGDVSQGLTQKPAGEPAPDTKAEPAMPSAAPKKDNLTAMRDWIKEVDARADKPDAVIEVQHLLVGVAMPQLPKVKRNKDEAEKLAADLLARVKAGEDFGQLIKEFTDDSPPGIYGMTLNGPGDRSKNIYPRKGMVPAFGNVGWKLAVGEIGVAP